MGIRLTDIDQPSLILYNHVAKNEYLSNFWSGSYAVIGQTSRLIRTFKEGQDPNVNQRLGEAYYLRGLTYFNLCRTFGRPYYRSPEVSLGVPIIDLLDLDPNNLKLPDRATVKAIYTQVINDLTKAESLMTVKKTAAYATKGAAQALLSRVYLYMSGTYETPNTEYANLAIQYANKVIASGNYSLLSRDQFMKYNTLAPDAPEQTETIFATKRVPADFKNEYNNTIGADYARLNEQGTGGILASEKYLNLLRKSGGKKDARWAFILPVKDSISQDPVKAFRFVYNVYNAGGVQTGYNYLQQPVQTNPDGSLYIMDNNQKYDLREEDVVENSYAIDYKGKTYLGELDYMMQTSKNHPFYYITKCSLQNNISHLHSPIISRLAEMYLNLAEAYAKIGDYQNAKINLNIIRERAIEGGGYATLTRENAAKRIDEERQLELAFEGHRGWDVFRNGQTMSRHYPGLHSAMVDIPATQLEAIQLIPQSEIDSYPGPLTQNK
jgi:hypothetical protein